MKVLIILSVVYIQSQAAAVTYHADWKNSEGGQGSYIIKDTENNPFVLKLVAPQFTEQVPEELPTSPKKEEEPPKEELPSTKKEGESPTEQPLPESLDDEGPVSITGPVSQFISQAAPSSSNSHLLASNTVTSHVPGSGTTGSLSGVHIPASGLNIPTSGLNVPASGLNVPATGITIPIESLLGSNIPLVAQTGGLTGSLLPVGSNIPLVSQVGSLTGSALPLGHVTGGLLNGPLLHHIQGLLHHLLGGQRPIIRPVHLSPGNLLLPGYSITVGAGGITLPGVTRH